MQTSERPMTPRSLVIRVRKLSESGSIYNNKTGKTDFKLSSRSFLTLITKLQSHLALCILLPIEIVH